MKKLLIVIGLVGVLFTFLQFSNPSLIGDDDVYWHIRYSENILTVPHLTSAFFGNPIPYAGVLFHLVLAPFTLIPNIFVAQKVAGVVLVCVISGLSYGLMRKMKIPYAILWTVGLFMISVNFSFRLLLVRTFLLSIILLLVGIYGIVYKKYWLLYLAAVAYALSYSIPFLLALAGWWVVAQFITGPFRKIDWRIPLIVLGGIITGTILHPVFPANIIFLKDFILPVLYKVPVQELGGGIELVPFTFIQFIQYEWMILVIWFLSIILFVKDYFRTPERTAKLFFMLNAVMFFVLAVMFRRFIEYWTLFAGLSAFYIFKPYLQKLNLLEFKEHFLKSWQMKTASLVFFAVIFLGAFNNVLTLHSWASDGAQIDAYANAGQWISVNIPAGSIVLNSDWTLYPKLYFFNSSAEYVAQFDPAYLYLKNRDQYFKWDLIANDKQDEWGSIEDLHRMAAVDFRANYLILKTEQNILLREFISKNDSSGQYFENVFSDETLTVYKVKK